MKKINVFLLLFCLFMVGCSSNKTKEVSTLDIFQSISINNGFNVSNNIDSYQDISYITGSMIATMDDITIEMVTYDNGESAKKAQDKHMVVFNTMKGSGAVVHKDKGKNYYKYDMVSNGYYMVSSRIDNTLVFSKTLVKNKDKVEAILNEMNY